MDFSDVRAYLEKSLPKYMVPNFIKQLDSLPYTQNGKIDKKKLPEIQFEPKNVFQISMPRNKTDEKLIAIMEEVLNEKNISIDDSFFELGGDSLSAISLSLKIQKELHCNIYVKDILELNSVKKISNYVSEMQDESSQVESINLAEKSAFYATSSAQKRIYYSSQVAGTNSVLYNTPGGIIFESNNIDIKKLENCFVQLINRHESFRTYFEIN